MGSLDPGLQQLPLSLGPPPMRKGCRAWGFVTNLCVHVSFDLTERRRADVRGALRISRSLSPENDQHSRGPNQTATQQGSSLNTTLHTSTRRAAEKRERCYK